MTDRILIDDREVNATLGQLGRRVTNVDAMLKIIGELMRKSIAYTFRDEGSPAGSWPELAASTKKRKGYTLGHMLLVLSGRLRNSFTYQVSGNQLTIGTDVVYARVHQLGSVDRSGASIGPQARIDGRSVKVGRHSFSRQREIHYTTREVRGHDGKTYRVPTPLTRGRYLPSGKAAPNSAFQGPLNRIRGSVGAHERFQNIPSRPFLVFRPEDPGNFVKGIEAYLGAGNVRVAP